MNKYIGHPSQLCGVFEKRLVGGMQDGMRVFEVRNGAGLEFVISADRCADIPYLYFKGRNIAYIAPCGMVAPSYYDKDGAGFLKSFTAGFLTTCGLTAVGSPCVDDGETLPLHGTISNTSAEYVSYSVDDEKITVTARIRDASLFSHQLILERKYTCPINENTIFLTDTVTNIGSKTSPVMILYHCNMGYPLLSEKSVLTIPSVKITARDKHAQEGIDRFKEITAPQEGFTEQCYYHSFDKNPCVSLYNPDIDCKMTMTFDINELDCFTQWKMLGENEYVMGLEPGNCYPDGRNVMREKGILKFLNKGEKQTYHIKFTFE